jgi:hypothetical protein
MQRFANIEFDGNVRRMANEFAHTRPLFYYSRLKIFTEFYHVLTVMELGEITSQNAFTIVHASKFVNCRSADYISYSRKAGCAI